MDAEDQKQIDQTLALCERAEWLYCVQTYLLMIACGPEESLIKSHPGEMRHKIMSVMALAGRVPSKVLKPDCLADMAIAFVDFHLAGKPKPDWLPA